MPIVDGDRYVAVASAAGAPANPSWYANLVAHPRVRLQDGVSVKEFQALEVSGDEKRHYWTVAERFWPHFPEYRRLAGGRDIPDHGVRANRAAYVHRQSSRVAQQGAGAGGVRHLVQSA
jgi:deazaflavin-dependent oxidoreductase (nitroreductase family)